LKNGLPATRRFGAVSRYINGGIEHLHDRLDLEHGRADADGFPLVREQLPRQFGVKHSQRVDGLLGCYFGSGHPEKMAVDGSNVLWRLRHSTANLQPTE
jgi:hypothetical protein